MAFWAQQGSSGGGGAQWGNNSRATAARPLSYVLGTSGPLVDHASLARLRVDVPSTLAALAAAAADDGVDEEAAAQVAQDAVCAVGQLHQVIRSIEDKAEDARVAAVLELMQDKTLQLLCSKAVVAKVYKSLLPHQKAVGFSMAPAKACLSQKPVAGWDLQEALQTAFIKTLTGSSTGTASSSSSSSPSTTPADTQGQLQGQQGWMCLSRHKLVDTNLLVAVPGQVSTALFAELEVVFDAGNKGMLLIVHAAGSLRFRPFSPCQVLQQDAKSLKAPLTLGDLDTDLLSDASKLAAATRQLDGRPIKLLPDDRLVFIKGLTAAPTDPTQLQRMAQFWLGCYGLLLPPSFPFLVGVVTHPEAEAAQMQVPSCCVLTNLGLSTLPGSQPGGSCHTAAVSRLAADLQAAAAGYSFWGHKLTVQLKGGGAGAGLSQTKIQLTQDTSQPAAGEVAGASAVQLQAYSLQNQWKPATELSKLQAQAGKQPQQQQQQEATAAELQLMGLVEADLLAFTGAGPGRQVGSGRQEGQRGAGASSSADKSRWEGLKAYLAEKDKQQKTQLHLSAGWGIAAPAAAGSLFSSAGTLTSKAAGSTAAAAAGAARAAAAAAAAAPSGAPAVPRFGSWKPRVSKPPSAAAAAAAKGSRAKKPGGAGSKLLAGLQAAQVEAAAAAAAVAGQDAPAAAGSLVTDPAAAEAARPSVPAVTPKAPAVGKRPGAADTAAAKPPAAKKAKTAAGAGAAAAKPKAPKKPKAAAAGGAAPPGAAAGAGAAAAAGPAAEVEQGAGPQPPSAAADQQQQQQQQQRKRAKASDLDLTAVTAKVQAAFAASAGAVLKGVSVPEMQCYLRAQGVKGGSAKRADVEARLLGLLAG